jgi:hypothetical protein
MIFLNCRKRKSRGESWFGENKRAGYLRSGTAGGKGNSQHVHQTLEFLTEILVTDFVFFIFFCILDMCHRHLPQRKRLFSAF